MFFCFVINLVAGIAGLALGGYPVLAGVNLGIALACLACAIRGDD